MEVRSIDGEVVARGLEFPEGPVWQGDHLLCTEVAGGAIARWSPEGGDAVRRVVVTGGGPNGATRGPDGALYVTQNGGMTSEDRVPAGILRVDVEAGTSRSIAGEVAGRRLEGPNDLAFGPDGRLWFTDPRGAADPARNQRPGRIFALDVASGEGELVVELGPVFPNGIGFLADGTLVWTESFTRRVMAWRDGTPDVVIELPERHPPDGFCVGADGALYVATTYAHCVSVVRDGRIAERLMCGDGMVTNCCFGGADGTELFATDARRGLLWRFGLGVTGLPLS
jgi:gluconolactonase